MNIHSFLLNFFVPALSGYLPHASHCEINQHNSQSPGTNTQIDIWELLILLQRLLILLYKILKKFKFLKIIQTFL